jgi:hypothetical protein
MSAQKFGAIALAGALALGVAACGGEAQASDQTPSTSTSQTPASTYANGMDETHARRVYLSTVKGSEYDGLKDGQLVRVGKAVCKDFRDSTDQSKRAWLVEIKAMHKLGFTGSAAGNITASAVQTYCPQYRSLLPDS